MKEEFYTVAEITDDIRQRLTEDNAKVEYCIANGDEMLVKLWFGKLHIWRYDPYQNVIAYVVSDINDVMLTETIEDILDL